MWWLIQSIALTIHYAVRRNLPFNLGWWGLTFPLGVFTGGTDLLGKALPVNLIDDAAVLFFAMLALFWVLVAVRTLRYLLGLRAARIGPERARSQLEVQASEG